MRKFSQVISFMGVLSTFLAVILGCGGSSSGPPPPEWTKSKKIAGKEQQLSHVSGLVVDDKFAYVIIGGTIADQNAGMSGLRKVDLSTGAVTSLDDGKNIPQSETGGIVVDDKYLYWNAGGKIWRIARENGSTPEPVASENVGIGIDMAIDNDKIYWANHSYYSPNSPTKPSPVYSVPKGGGKVEIFADQQNVPHNVLVDEKFVYWVTPASILKQAKAGGKVETVYQATEREGVDNLTQDAENLYFGFRGAGESRWDLRKMSKQGGEPVTLVKKYSLKPVVVDDTNIYFFNEKGMTAEVLCKIPKTGGEVTELDSGYSSGVITQGKTQVYFGSLDTIYSFQK